VVSRKWGFTEFNREEYETLRKEGGIRQDGVIAKRITGHGPLTKWIEYQN